MSSSRITTYRYGKQPTKFRVIIKSKCGFNPVTYQQLQLKQSRQTHNQLQQKSRSRSKSGDIKNNQMTSNTKLNNSQIINTNKKDIKDFVRTMKNKTRYNLTTRVKTMGNCNEIDDDNKSIKSNKSCAINTTPHQTLNKDSSASQIPLLAADNKNNTQKYQIPQARNKSSIKQLQHRIDFLLQMKMANSANKKYKQANKQKQKSINKDIDRQINQIIQAFKNSQSQLVSQQKLQDINKKINIVQKIMAEGMVQSDIAKKTYFKIVNNRSYLNKRPTIGLSLNEQIKKMKQRAKMLINQSNLTSIGYETTNRFNYKAPDSKSYATRLAKTSYQFKNQPIQRSSYNRDFLVYGNLPKFTFKQQCSNVFPNHSTGKKTTSYSSQFTNKKIQKINFKQLDCYHDKIKNTNISFSQLNRPNTQIKNRADPEKCQGQIKQRLQKTVRHKTQDSHYINNLSTESRMSFKGDNNNIISNIKHKNLYDLKYSYRANMCI